MSRARNLGQRPPTSRDPDGIGVRKAMQGRMHRAQLIFAAQFHLLRTILAVVETLVGMVPTYDYEPINKVIVRLVYCRGDEDGTKTLDILSELYEQLGREDLWEIQDELYPIQKAAHRLAKQANAQRMNHS